MKTWSTKANLAGFRQNFSHCARKTKEISLKRVVVRDELCDGSGGDLRERDGGLAVHSSANHSVYDARSNRTYRRTEHLIAAGEE